MSTKGSITHHHPRDRMPRVGTGGALASSIFDPFLRVLCFSKPLYLVAVEPPRGTGLKAPALNGYASASEFSVCRCGSNMWSNRVNSDKLTDPGLLWKRNAWSRLRPDS